MARLNVECPSGLKGTVRGLKGKELRMLGNREGAETGETFENLLRDCWVEITDYGPYEVEPGGRFDWLNALQGDRFYALCAIRRATFKYPYPFDVKCGNRTCGKMIHWEVDLNDLPLQRLSEASKATFVRDNRFSATINGKTLWFRLLTGKDEKKAAATLKPLADGDADMIQAISFRTLEIEGVDQSEIDDFFDDQEADDLVQLLSAMQKADCGLETTLTVKCAKCGVEQEVDLPFGREFFLPKARTPTPPDGDQKASGTK